MSDTPRLSVLIAFRDSSEDQARWDIWNWIASQYQQFLPEVQLRVCSDDGEDPFHKTVALNRAAAAATAPVLMLADADTWVPSAQIREALTLIETDPSIWVRPWNLKLKLGEVDTQRLMTKAVWDGVVPEGADLPGRRESLNTYWAAPHHIFTREQFEKVGGFDERFRGWGQEDEAFALSLRSIVGKPKLVRGYAIHLKHPRLGRSGRDQWVGETTPRANEALVAEYRKRVRNPKQMEQLVRSR